MDSAIENLLSHSTSLPVTRSKAPDLQNHLPPFVYKYLEFCPPPGSSSYVSFQYKTTAATLSHQYQATCHRKDSEISIYIHCIHSSYRPKNTAASFPGWIHTSQTMLSHQVQPKWRDTKLQGQQRLLMLALALRLIGDFLNNNPREIQRFVITTRLVDGVLTFTNAPAGWTGGTDRYEA